MWGYFVWQNVGCCEWIWSLQFQSFYPEDKGRSFLKACTSLPVYTVSLPKSQHYTSREPRQPLTSISGSFLLPSSSCSFLGALAKLRKATISFVKSVRLSAWNKSAPSGLVLKKFDIWDFFRKSVEKIPSNRNLDGPKTRSERYRQTKTLCPCWWWN